MNGLASQSRRLDLIVLAGIALHLWVLCTLEYRPYSFIFRDGSFYAQTNRSIAEEFTLRQERFQPRSWYDGSLPWYQDVDSAWSNLSVGADGEWYPKHSYLMPVFSTPFYLLLGPPGLLLFNMLALALGLFAGYRLAARWVGEVPAAVGAMLATATPLTDYVGYAYSHDVFYAALVAWGALLLAERRCAWGGLLFGLAVYAKLTNAIVVAPLGIALLGRDRRGWTRAVVAGAVPLAVYALANTVMYGNPWTTSYQRMLTVVGGQQVIASSGEAFDTPLWPGLVRFFSASAEGELARMALLPVVAYVGCVPLILRAPAIGLGLGASFLAFLVVFAKYHFSGARFFLPWLVLSPLPAGALVDAAAGIVGRGASAWGRLGTATRAWGSLAVGVSTLVAIVLAWALPAPPPREMARDVERLAVTLDGRPCDYFNLAHFKWECSRMDPGGEYYVGRSLGDQCALGGGPMLWVPASPSRWTRVVTWYPQVSGRALHVRWGLDRSSRASRAEFEVSAGGASVLRADASKPGVLADKEIEVPVEELAPIRLTVRPAATQDVRLCVGIEVVGDGGSQ